MSEEGALPEASALRHTEEPKRDKVAVAAGDGPEHDKVAVAAGDGPEGGARPAPLVGRLWARLDRRWPRLGKRLRITSFALLAVAALAIVADEISLRRDRFHHGATWRASSGGYGFAAQGKGSAVLGGSIFFHTNSEAKPWLEVDLGQAVPIESVEVTNRLDCCSTRSLPLVIEVATEPGAWVEVARRRQNFITWKATFDERPARYVRLRLDATGILHLTDLAIR